MSPTTSVKTQLSLTDWNPGTQIDIAHAIAGCSPIPTTFPSSFREIQATATVLDNAIESNLSFSYDGYGNLTDTIVAGRDACPSQGCAMGSAHSHIDYGDGNYFPVGKDPGGRVTKVSFSPESGASLCTQEVQSQSPEICNSYDALGRLTQVTDSSLLDSANHLTHPKEIRVSQWCASGKGCTMKTQTAQTGSSTSTVYIDMLGRAIGQGVEALDLNEVVTRIAFNLRGQKITDYPPAESRVGAGQWDGTFASPYPTTYLYDVLGRQTSKTVNRNPALFNGQGDAAMTTTYCYSVDGVAPANCTQIGTPLPGITANISVPKATAAGGALAMSRTYDRMGKLVSTTQRMGGATPADVTSQYFYDPMGSVVQIVDANGNDITAVYDDLGRKKKVSDADRGDSFYSWDGLGRLRTEMDANGNLSLYVYDDVGRKLNRYVNTNLDSTWTYTESTGRLASVAGVDRFSRSYDYDGYLRLVKTTTHVPARDCLPDGDDCVVNGNWSSRDFTEQQSYDGAYGRIKAVEYPSGEMVRLDYDLRTGVPIGETQVGALGAVGTQYRSVSATSPRGMPSIERLGNNINEIVKYDDSTGMALAVATSAGAAPPTSLVNPASLSCSDIPGSSIRCLEFKYDQFSNLVQQTKYMMPSVNGAAGSQLASATEYYQYDDLQRLTNESRWYSGFSPVGSLSESYTYDKVGNILSKSDFGGSYVYGDSGRSQRYAGPHAVLAVNAPVGASVPWLYTYDMNGNMVSDGQRTVQYDDQDRPVRIMLGRVTTIFRYTPEGDRYLQRTTNRDDPSVNRTIYYVDKAYERVDWDSQPTEERTYCGKSVVIAQKALSQAPWFNRDVRYVHRDRLGSTDAVTDSSGAEMIGDGHGYDAFGKPRGREWLSSNGQLHPKGGFGTTTSRGFTGHEQLDETYLTHMNGRVYDYRLGRFLSVDPIIGGPVGSQSINPYSYIGNNPLSGVDPTGYQKELVGGPSSGCAEFSRCDVTFINYPKTTLVDKNGNVLGVVPADIASQISRILAPSSNAQYLVSGSQSRSQAGADTAEAPFASFSISITTAGDVGHKLDDWAGALEKFAFGDAGRPPYFIPFVSPLTAPSDLLRMVGDPLKLGEGVGATLDPTLGIGTRAWGAVQDVLRVSMVAGPVLEEINAGTNAITSIRTGGDGIRVSQKGFDIVAEHLAQFGEHAPNTAMLERLAAAIGSKVSGADANFYLHELAEWKMMSRGMSYDLAHAAAIDKYSVSQFSLYHPEVIRLFPAEFNNAWRAFWGIK